MSGERRCVCFGSSRVSATSETARLAHECGGALAGAGWTVMTGGYEGVMGAVSRGAKAAGGRVIGVTTPVFRERTPNDALHVEWPEPDYLARMSTLLRQGHAFVGLPGGLGTLSEWLAAACLVSIGQLGGPVVLFRDPWEPVLREVLRLPEVEPEVAEFVRLVNNVDDLMQALQSD